MAKQIKADENYTLVRQLLQVADIFIKIREKELLQQNLSATAAEILFLVDAIGKDVTAAKITRMMMREQQSISNILKRMEKQGLLRMTKDMERKNLVRITLTAKGEKDLKQALKKKGTTNVMAKLTVDQQKHLKTAMTTLKEAGIKELYRLPKELPWP